MHASLYQELDRLGVSQIVYSYFRKASGKRNEFDASNTVFVLRPILRQYHRALYHLKVSRVFHDVCNTVEISKVSISHATTLFSDGAIAYKLFNKYRIPYVVAVRSTDVDDFLRLAPHTWRMGRQVLLNAQKVVFITESLKEKLLSHPFICHDKDAVIQKTIVRPNGIPDYWLSDISCDIVHENNVLYIGSFLKRKNVLMLEKAIVSLRKEPGFENIKLTLVGGGGGQARAVEQFARNNKEAIEYLGRIRDSDMLKQIYRRNSIFAMPSVNETFGLVYLEALSNNLAIIYTAGTGIDGFFDASVGERIVQPTVQKLVAALKMILSHRDRYSNSSVDFNSFRWSRIADYYYGIYREIGR